MPYNANQHEKEILELWKEDESFEKSIRQRPEDKPYVFYDGPPFATGLPHYGHILSSVAKDVVPRYWTMKGYRVRRRWGWDCHGLPIESLIEKQLEISGKKDVEEKIGVEQFNESCRNAVLQYAADWKTMVDRMGRWVEFDNAYKTMDTPYMESIWWALKKIWDDGRIYEGRKVLMYCPRCETPVAKAEIAMDHSYKDITEESVVVKFKILNFQFDISGVEEPLPVYVLAWTTTPWTLPGNVGLAIGNDIQYSLVKHNDAYYVLAKDRLMKYFDTNHDEFQVMAQLKGSELVGLDYEPLFDMPAMRETGKRAYHIMAGDFVTTEEGTGIVHTAVMYGEDDYQLGLAHDLPIVPMLDEKGHFNEVAPIAIQGQYYKKAEKEIKRDLESRGLLFAKQQTTHAYPHCWRCDTALIYNAVSAWFINIQDVKPRMLELNENVEWFPDHLKHGRFQHILETAPDWNISRNRYWATALPFWRCENNSGKRTMPAGRQEADHAGRQAGSGKDCVDVCIGSIEELKERAANFDAVFADDVEVDLHKHQMDKIILRCACGADMHRIPEVIDCWFEAGSMPYAEFHYPFENKEIFEQRFPGQYISEYVAQTRAWFYYMHVVATLLFDSHSFDHVVCTGTILNEKGEKLSKSKRNFTDPWIIIEQYGMDALRYYLMTSVVMQGENLFFNDREVRDVYNKVLNTLWNVVEFYRMYAAETPLQLPPSRGEGTVGVYANVLDRWIMAKTNRLVKEMTEHMDAYDLVKAGRAVKPFVEDLSQWYVRRSRDRFKRQTTDDRRQTTEPIEEDFEHAIGTLRDVLLTVSKVIAPFMPFMAEQVYQSVLRPQTSGKRIQMTEACLAARQVRQESVHLQMWPEAGEVDETVLTEMEHARKMVEMGLSLRKDAGIRVRQPLQTFRVQGSGFSEELMAIIADEINVKNVEVVENDQEVAGDEWVKKTDGDITAWLHTKITDELKKEGLLREVVRAVNGMRKEQKLTPQDTARLFYHTDDAVLQSVFTDFADELKRSTKVTEMKDGGEHVVNIDGIPLKITLKK